MVAHAGEAQYAALRPLAAHVLHAADQNRKRGYPVNVALEYCLRQLPHVRYVFLLDDDDIVYPFFTRLMAEAFEQSQADVVYARANGRDAEGAPAAAFPLKPVYHLLDRNFMPSNSYAIRTAALRRAPVNMPEDMDSLEDWLFLLTLLERGYAFAPLEATLSEFRAQGDALSYDLDQWKSNAQRIRQYINRTKFPLPGGELAMLAERETAIRAPLFEASTNSALHRRIWELEHSLSWRWTAPIRAIVSKLQRLRTRG